MLDRLIDLTFNSVEASTVCVLGYCLLVHWKNEKTEAKGEAVISLLG